MTSPLLRLAAQVAVLLGISAGLGAGYWLQVESGIEWSPASFRDYLDGLGPISRVVFVGAMAMRPMLALPSWIVMAAGGVAFGVVEGALLSTLGGVLGAVLIFGAARILGREFVERRVGGALAQMDRYLERRGPGFVALYSGLPITPLTPAFAAAGLTAMKWIPFTVGATVGLLPRALLYSLLGDSVVDLDWPRLLLVGVLFCAALIAIAPARRYLFAPLPTEGASPLPPVSVSVSSEPSEGCSRESIVKRNHGR